jgi:DNA-binding MarR family transcriptional regulator
MLAEIDRNPRISQKDLGTQVGLAPSMVNNYMKQLCDDGMVHKRGLNNKRTTYHLTDAGCRMLKDLGSQYVAEVLRLYVRLTVDLHRFRENGISRVMLHGAAEACDAVRQAAEEIGLEVVKAGATDDVGGWAGAPPRQTYGVLLASAESLEQETAVQDYGVTVYRM